MLFIYYIVNFVPDENYAQTVIKDLHENRIGFYLSRMKNILKVKEKNDLGCKVTLF